MKSTVTQTTEPTPRVIEVGRTQWRDQTGRFETTYKLTYLVLQTSGETVRMVRRLPKRGVESVGRVVGRLADRGEAWDIAVLDASGEDVTDEFGCLDGEAW